MNQSVNYEENKYGIESIFDNLLTEYRKLQIHKYGMIYITTVDISEGLSRLDLSPLTAPQSTERKPLSVQAFT